MKTLVVISSMVCSLLFKNGISQIRFEDISNAANLNWVANKGCAMGDFNNDGFDDIFLASGLGLDALLLNNGSGQFTNVTRQSGAGFDGFTASAAWGDINNDGLLDLLVTCLDQGNRLYVNIGDGMFSTKLLSEEPTQYLDYSYTGSFADFDNDGILDIFIANFTNTPQDRLLRGNGDGTFEDVSRETGIAGIGDGKSRCGAWCDFDNDGDIDLFVCSQREDIFYVNNGDGVFTPKVIEYGDNIGCSWADYNGDGLFDLSIASRTGDHNKLLRNVGGGDFEDVTESTNLTLLYDAHNFIWQDLDNDGDIDALIYGKPGYGQTIAICSNLGSGIFREVTSESGIDPSIDGEGVCFGDVNNDGFSDVVFTTFTQMRSYVYRNKGNSNHWISLRLEGTRSNRTAIGAVVEATHNGKTQIRQVEGGSGFLCQNSLPVEFGLGSSEQIDSLTIRWPSGIVQTLRQLNGNQILTIEEPSDVPVYGAPKIVSIRDVPNDQGRAVRIKWARSPFDISTAKNRTITKYSIWRKIDSDLGLHATQKISEASSDWDFVCELPAIQDSFYNVLAPTLADSTKLHGIYYSTFLVRAHAASPTMHWPSLPDSGYSVDNLSPQRIENLAALNKGGEVLLSWAKAPETDLLCYNIYRSAASSSESITKIGTTINSNFVDNSVTSGERYSYSVTATDISGNEGESSEIVIIETSGEFNHQNPSKFALYQNYPNPFNNSTIISFEVAETCEVQLDVFNAVGQKIANLITSTLQPGSYDANWNGSTSNGEKASTGLYIVQLRAGAFSEKRKMALIQ